MVRAQHHMPGMTDSTKNKRMMQDSSMMGIDIPPMSHSYSLNLPMSRNGSGTAWLPDASPMYGIMVHSKKWMYMFHGNIAPRYTKQDLGNKGSRGDEAFDAPNWFMAMGQRKVGQKGLFRMTCFLNFQLVILMPFPNNQICLSMSAIRENLLWDQWHLCTALRPCLTRMRQ